MSNLPAKHLRWGAVQRSSGSAAKTLGRLGNSGKLGKAWPKAGHWHPFQSPTRALGAMPQFLLTPGATLDHQGQGIAHVTQSWALIDLLLHRRKGRPYPDDSMGCVLEAKTGLDGPTELGGLHVPCCGCTYYNEQSVICEHLCCSLQTPKLRMGTACQAR